MKHVQTKAVERLWVNEYELDIGGLVLRGPNGDVAVEPKVMQVIVMLAQTPGEVVTRETLMDSVWAVEFGSDESLTRAISVLRKSFGDNHGRRTIIETVPRKGYRLIAQVSRKGPIQAPSTVLPFVSPQIQIANDIAPPKGNHNKIAGFVSMALLGLLALSFLIFQLPSLRAVPNTASERSIAVLPFSSTSIDIQDELFAQGLTEELLNTLSRLEDLKVAARRSSFAYKGKTMNVKNIGHDLNVAYVLEGSIRRSGERMRITAQLISVEDGFNLWSNSYDREQDDVFAVQDDIAKQVANALDLQLIGDETLFNAGTKSATAFRHYLQGRQYLNRRGLGLAQAISYFEQAIEEDPDYARAYGGLATAHVVSHIYLDVPKAIARQRADDFAKKALSLNPDLSEPYAVLGVIQANQNNWEAAIANYEKGTVLDPNNVVVLQWMAEALTYLGYLERANTAIEKAIEIEPNSAVLYLVAGLVAQNQDDIPKAEELYDRAESLGLSDGINGNSFIELDKGNLKRAAEMMALASFNDRYIAEDEVKALSDFMLAIMRHEKKVDNGIYDFPILAVDDDFMVPAYLMSGESEMALRLLEQDPDGDQDSLYLLWTNLDPGLRQAPYFKTFAKNIGLYDYWQAHGWPDKCKPLRGDSRDYECS